MITKEKYVKDIKEGEYVKDLFLVGNKALLSSGNGKPYLSLTLRDRTGQLECRVWDRADEIAKRFDRDDIVEASGMSIIYQGRIQIKVNDIRKAELEKVDIGEFLPVTRQGIDPLWAKLQGLVAGITDPDLSTLLHAVFPDPPVTDMARRFRQAPGGKTMHHDYIGGLMEHTVSAATICAFLSGHYESVNGDLIVAGALLHDIGKVEELSYAGAFDYTDEGRLLGHLYMGAEWVSRQCDAIPGFPDAKRILLKHMILSHHGELEYGSPKRPKTLEAILLHFVENMDAKAAAFTDAMEELREGARWTDYQRMFERYLFSGNFEK